MLSSSSAGGWQCLCDGGGSPPWPPSIDWALTLKLGDAVNTNGEILITNARASIAARTEWAQTVPSCVGTGILLSRAREQMNLEMCFVAVFLPKGKRKTNIGMYVISQARDTCLPAINFSNDNST